MKLLVVILVLVAALYVVSVTMGPGDGGPMPPEWLKKWGSAEAVPKLELAKKSFALTTSGAKVEIPPGDAPFRKAVFHLKSGIARLVYKVPPEAESKVEKDLREQKIDLPDPKADDPRRGTLMILKVGGTLTLTAVGGPAAVELE